MQIVDAKYEVLEEPKISRKIERIARICYKSEGLIGEGTDVKMIRSLVNRKHLAMLEHGDLCFRANLELRLSQIESCLISGNLRAWMETLEQIAETCGIFFSWFAGYVSRALEIPELWETYLERKDLTRPSIQDRAELVIHFKQLNREERLIHETLSVIFTADRGFSHELVRMRPCSFAQESTRYCNYSKDKYGNEITVIRPVWWEQWTQQERDFWLTAMKQAENSYLSMTKAGVPAQAARGVLPHSVKMDICCTAALQEWHHIFQLRACDATGPAHPQMKELMCPLCAWAKKTYDPLFEDCEVAIG